MKHVLIICLVAVTALSACNNNTCVEEPRLCDSPFNEEELKRIDTASFPPAADTLHQQIK